MIGTFACVHFLMSAIDRTWVQEYKLATHLIVRSPTRSIYRLADTSMTPVGFVIPIFEIKPFALNSRKIARLHCTSRRIIVNKIRRAQIVVHENR